MKSLGRHGGEATKLEQERRSSLRHHNRDRRLPSGGPFLSSTPRHPGDGAF